LDPTSDTRVCQCKITIEWHSITILKNSGLD
jgi:hypothetical protein